MKVDVRELMRQSYHEALQNGPEEIHAVLEPEADFDLQEHGDSTGEPAYYVRLRVKKSDNYRLRVSVERMISELLQSKLIENDDGHYPYISLEEATEGEVDRRKAGV